MNEHPSPSGENARPVATGRQLLLATVTALSLASAALLIAILPAEFGIDPLGTGRALGLLELADANDSPFEKTAQGHQQERMEFFLEPYQSLEYKYHLSEDSTMVFSWQASSDLYVDMHADPDGFEGDEYVQSFEKATSRGSAGVYHAPFTGIHGWFWENRSFENVVLVLESAGFYDSAVLFRDGGRFDREVTPALP